MIVKRIKSIKKNVVSLLVVFYFLSTKFLLAQTPVASFTSDVQIGCAPLSVHFTNTSTGANSFSWNFGNTNTSTLFNPSTVFLTPNTYTVTLIATNTANGQQSTFTATITVVPNPIADFTASAVTGCANSNSICFTNNSQFAASHSRTTN